MTYLPRLAEAEIRRHLDRAKSVLLLGPRQTGKTTLIGRLQADLSLTLVPPDVRQRYERHPSLLAGEVEAIRREVTPRRKPLVVLDEVQKVPALLDVVQDLIDRKIATFVLSGSSARKLRRGGSINLLPGRVVALRLDPLTTAELGEEDLERLLLYGSLPGIHSVVQDRDKDTDLASYVTIYLEEEVRAEALVRTVGPFARFLEYAADESGRIVNFTKLSQEIGVAHTTVASYYGILEDCLIAERVEPISSSPTRKKLTRANKYLFFDLGVRRAAAREGAELRREASGLLFEQFVGLELIRLGRCLSPGWRLHFWRDPDGPEVDWVLAAGKEYIPIEVKWTDTPTASDTKHIQVFLNEYKTARRGFVVCRAPRRIQLANRIQAIPWQELQTLFRS